MMIININDGNNSDNNIDNYDNNNNIINNNVNNYIINNDYNVIKNRNNFYYYINYCSYDDNAKKTIMIIVRII